MLKSGALFILTPVTGFHCRILTILFWLSARNCICYSTAESALEHNRLPQAFLKGLDHACQWIVPKDCWQLKENKSTLFTRTNLKRILQLKVASCNKLFIPAEKLFFPEKHIAHNVFMWIRENLNWGFENYMCNKFLVGLWDEQVMAIPHNGIIKNTAWVSQFKAFISASTYFMCSAFTNTYKLFMMQPAWSTSENRVCLKVNISVCFLK